MSATPTTFTEIINEASTAVYTAVLKDENAAVIPAASIDVLTLTLSNVADDAIINSRNGQNVLNANNVTVTAGGVLTWTMQPADTAIIDATRTLETHRATFQMQFNTVSFSTWDVDLVVRNLGKVT